MVIGVPKEIKPQEFRVAVTPPGAAALLGDGHRVLVETAAGAGSGFDDARYTEAGAEVVDRARLFSEAELILKVKEPLPEEFGLLGEGAALFTFLHLAPNPALTEALLKKRVSAFAYETLKDMGGLPLLSPMSEIAGKMAPLMAAFYMQRPVGGSGVLASGVTGVPPARMLVIGAGVVGSSAVRVAHSMGMRVTVLNRGIEKLRPLDERYGGHVETLPASESAIKELIKEADAVVGAVHSPGMRAPLCVSRKMVASMRRGSVIVDVSIDQGGCVETSRPTTHEAPVFEAEGVIHYCVSNMPGAYPRTSTFALTNSTIGYARRLAAMGVARAIKEDAALRSALNVHSGEIVHPGLLPSTA